MWKYKLSKQPLQKILQEYAHCFLEPDIISYQQESNAENYVLLHLFIYYLLCLHIFML